MTTSGRALWAEYALPELMGYAIGKSAQVGLMNALAADGASAGIRVNSISPVAATRMYGSQNRIFPARNTDRHFLSQPERIYWL